MPHLIDMTGLWFFLFLRLFHIPCPDMQKTEQIGLIYLGHAPAAFQQRVISTVNEIRQRQVAGVSTVSFAAFVGNSDNTAVVCVCTAMSANARSCIRRSTG